MTLSLLASTDANLGIVRKNNAVHRNLGFFRNIDPVLSLSVIVIASVYYWDFIFGEDGAG
jgi:hypothetical protein